mmetsp:Transcript_23145/g.54891  ORF Transcript_23145/g.54891 Transcript_23145/m.54891 type:complete len:213 (+) Transcript_23145:796-1434(+)
MLATDARLIEARGHEDELLVLALRLPEQVEDHRQHLPELSADHLRVVARLPAAILLLPVLGLVDRRCDRRAVQAARLALARRRPELHGGGGGLADVCEGSFRHRHQRRLALRRRAERLQRRAVSVVLFLLRDYRRPGGEALDPLSAREEHLAERRPEGCARRALLDDAPHLLHLQPVLLGLVGEGEEALARVHPELLPRLLHLLRPILPHRR